MSGDWKQRASEGITVFRASRLEALLEPLDHLLATQRPDGLLAPQTVVAAHPGMRQWLAGALAEHRKAGGIVANLDILLPSGFLDRLAGELLGDGATSAEAWRREHLRWRLFDLLPRVRDPALAALLEAEDAERRRFQVADRLARIHTQYMAYRPDWLATWAAGGRGFAQAGVHPGLWRALAEVTDAPHRGERLARLAERLRTGEVRLAATDPLHVFGLSHLAPAELAVLQALATHRPVVFYVPDPCREFWGGLRGERARLRALAKDPYGPEAEREFLGQDHPLLAAWGRLGQHFMLQLQDLDASLDVRDFRDEQPQDAAPTRLLDRLQESLRRLDPALLASDPRPPAERRADASLRVHACHTRLRELEALRDALLLARSQDPTLAPHDIVVMAPDIAAYVPLLPAVFGEPGDPRAPLPYHLADVPAGRASPLLAAFRQLLALPASRGTAPELLDFLAQPDVARRLGLDADALAALEHWLAGARAAWGLDPQARAALGVPPIEAHTLAWAMDRLLASHVFGEDDPTVLLDAGGDAVAPVPGVGAGAEALGALDHLLQQLAQLRADAARPRPASAWAARLEGLLDQLFLPDPGDPAGREAMDQLRALVRGLAEEPAAVGLDPPIGFGLVRQWLEQRLDAVPERQRFLAGGITVCGMVPQRAIPFRFVAVIGLNEGEYPRDDRDAGLDPIRQAGLRRLGDRDTRSDDRYLFLETVMAARDRLHLGFLGADPREGHARNPAGPLAELMAALPPGEGGAAPPWRVDHALQPFDARYFRGDPALPCFSPGLAAMVGGAPDAPALLAPALPAPSEAGPSDAAPVAISLNRVLAWCRDPARAVLADGLGARLDALGERRLSADEPLEARLDVFDRQARALAEQALADPGDPLDDPPPPHLVLGGVLPPGLLGVRAWAAEQAQARTLAEAARGRTDAAALLSPALAPPVVPAIARRVGRFGIEGDLANVRGRDDALFVVALLPHREGESKLGFRERLPLFIAWALCRLAPENAGRRVQALALTAKAGRTPWQDALAGFDARLLAADAGTRAAMLARLEAKLAFLLDVASRPATAPWPYFPATSWLLLDEDAEVAETWQRECGYAPGYARLLGRGLSPDEHDDWRLALADGARALWTAIQPDAGEAA